VHSLHHRNTDIEPFSGLCMHPIEHLYYYSCVGPSLYFTMSPFHAMWNLIHLLISPAASHSGWEDNMQSDQFHYLHHKKFECNYGTGGEPLDKLFGTHRTSLDPGVKTYTGGASESELKAEAALNVDQGETKGSGKTSEGKYVPAKRGICNWDTKGGGLSLAKAVPGLQDGIYHLHYIIMFALLANTMLGDPLATGLGGLDASWAVPLPGKLGQYAAITPGVFWGLTVAVGPMVFAMLLLTIFGDKVRRASFASGEGGGEHKCPPVSTRVSIASGSHFVRLPFVTPPPPPPGPPPLAWAVLDALAIPQGQHPRLLRFPRWRRRRHGRHAGLPHRCVHVQRARAVAHPLPVGRPHRETSPGSL
jgi:hypothetical protein